MYQNKKIQSIFFLSVLALASACENSVSFLDATEFDVAGKNDAPIDEASLGEPGTTDSALDQVRRACNAVSGQVQQHAFTVVFEKPGTTCEWNQNGNLGPRDRYFQARIEQQVPVTVPVGATLCDMELAFQPQSMLYDDHFLLLLNRSVLASSYDFGQNLSSQYDIPQYDWSRLAGTSWNSDTRQEGVFCAGAAEGKSSCSWPKTDTTGQIRMDFDSDIFMRIMAANNGSSEHAFTMIAVGDNDDNDCEHSRLEFNVVLSYVK